MSGALHYILRDCGLGREQILCAGEGEPCLLILPPLFDEMHKLRRTLVMAMRALADRGIASILPDLPGLNESQTPLSQCHLSDWRSAMRIAADECGATHVAGIRSACLLDEGFFDDEFRHLPRWRYAPMVGARLTTQMIRAQMAGDKAAGRASKREDYEPVEDHASIQLSGYTISGAIMTQLTAATIAPLSGKHDHLVEGSLGPALWLRAEPGESAELAQALADSWAKWMTQ